MTIVINVQAIRDCHWRTYTAALKDSAISINVPCPSVATSSLPLNNLAAMWYCVSFTYSWTVSHRCPVESGHNGTFRLPFFFFFLHCAIVGQMSMCLLCVPSFFSAGYIQDCLFFFREARKSKFKSRLSQPRGSFSLSWIMATNTEDIGLGCACFIKLKVLCRMQNKLVEWESSWIWWIDF